jgi:hypothetical protein
MNVQVRECSPKMGTRGGFFVTEYYFESAQIHLPFKSM